MKARIYCAVAQPLEGGVPATAITTVHKDDYDALKTQHDLAWSALGHLCQNPDEVGRGCGDCLGCDIYTAAIRQARAAAEDNAA